MQSNGKVFVCKVSQETEIKGNTRTNPYLLPLNDHNAFNYRIDNSSAQGGID